MKPAVATLLFLLSFQLNAANYTVKVAGGGDFATITECSAAVKSGDTCTVFAGTYGGWTQSKSGSAGHPITFTSNPGDTVIINSPVDISSQSFINLTYLTFSNANITGNGSTSHNLIDHDTFVGSSPSGPAFYIADGQGSGGSDNIISNNTVNWTGPNQFCAFYVYGDRNRFENNNATGYGDDFLDAGGTNVVIRGNYGHDINGNTSGQSQHIDFVQVIGGGTTPTLSFSLIENNVLRNCENNGGNCHGIAIIRTGGPVADSNILRYNYAQNFDGDCVNFGGIGDNVPNNSMYNNTCAARSTLATYGGSCDSTQGTVPNISVFNNICYDMETGGLYPFSGADLGGNLTFTTGFSGLWDSPYQSEATYSILANKDPQFANYPDDGTLKPASAAVGGGVALTSATGSGANSTSLVVGNAHLFQPGWAGVKGDCIRVGASATTCITGIDYTTSTLTIAPPISWDTGAQVYLYSNSTGTTVLYRSNPDVGAYPYPAVMSTSIDPPLGLSATAH